MNAFTDFKQYIDYKKVNPWYGTPFEDFYTLHPSQKGIIGEEIVKNYLRDNSYKVKPRTNVGHDCIVNGKKTEIKFGLATDGNTNYQFMFNHISLGKDWEQILFMGINGNGEIVCTVFQKEELPINLFSRQQGGNKIQNDDYMITGEKSRQLLFSSKGKRLI